MKIRSSAVRFARFVWPGLLKTMGITIILFIISGDSQNFLRVHYYIPPPAQRAFDVEEFLNYAAAENQQVSKWLFAAWVEKRDIERKKQSDADLGEKIRKTLFYAKAEQAGLDPEALHNIDSIMLHAIEMGAMPGGQIFVAKKGIIVYEKAFGYHDYSQSRPVNLDDLYDVSSLTKIAATTLAAMKLTQDSILQLNAPLGSYFRDTTIRYTRIRRDTVVVKRTLSIAGLSEDEIQQKVRGRKIIYRSDSVLHMNETIRRIHLPESNIFRVPIYRLLAHHSGVSPSLPLTTYTDFPDTYLKIRRNDPSKIMLAANNRENHEDINANPDDILLKDTREVDFVNEPVSSFRFTRDEAFSYFFSRNHTANASVSITDSMYLRNQFMDSLYQAVKRIRVFPKDGLKYSCINMILLQMAIDSLTRTNLDEFMKKEFYLPLGMKNTTFNPLQSFPRERITPTENEKIWRMQLIHGTVHDPSAALLGGIAGNAGLFSTASDLGILGQMLLNGGIYGDQRFLSNEIIELFTSKQSLNHRGLGFNKPTAKGIHAPDASESTYGHTGFTGTAMWVDPENEIVFVFLSNRIHPSASNELLQKMRVRERVHQVVYDAIKK
jgi:CubicO group peptidase (beta-lactamase class C family)